MILLEVSLFCSLKKIKIKKGSFVGVSRIETNTRI